MLPEARRFLHVAAAKVMHYSGALTLWRWFRQEVLRRDEVCVLGLHRVLTRSEQELSNSLDGMIIRENTYLALLAYLQRRFDVVSLDTLLCNKKQPVASPRPRCVITFDDGWADTYSRAFPGLRKFSLPGVVFLATGSIGQRGGFWIERVKGAWRLPATRERAQSALSGFLETNSLAHAELEALIEWLKRMSTEKRNAILERILPANENSCDRKEVDAMLTWDQAREMSEAGVEMGAHTVSHPLLSYEDEASVECELRISKQMLEDKLGKKIRAFAYPNGNWSERIREQVAATGYQCAFTTHAAWHDREENPYTISRVLLHEGNITAKPGEFSPAMLALTLSGWA
jgi:peptidoglycan/xylan/chitin deacetylase (PgdA/CDA1 family)